MLKRITAAAGIAATVLGISLGASACSGSGGYHDMSTLQGSVTQQVNKTLTADPTLISMGILA